MKTIEKKARAYDEVLNKLRHFIAKGVDPLITRADVQDFFPELAESEDEKVRKALISFLKSPFVNENITDEHVAPWLAWLEKQGKKLSIWTDSDRIMAFTLLRDVDQMTYISDEGKNERLQWLNSLEDKFNNGE